MQSIHTEKRKMAISNLLIASLSWVVLAPMAMAAQQPSVLVIIADDQGWGDLSRHGNQNLATPQLDALAEQGASFSRFYVQPVCSPTRAELLTGRYASRGEVRGVTAGGERLDASVPTIADAFSAAGYATAAFGKWHNGTQAPYHPLCRGFDSYYGFTSGHWANYFQPMLDRDGRITEGEGYLPDDLTDETIRFVRANRNRPFFALLAYNTPHSPMQVPDRWWKKHADQTLGQRGSLPKRENVQHTRAALAMCENIDWNVGRLLAALEESGAAENTIVVYLSDNGPNGHRYNAGLRGVKGSTDEGGVRSPLFVRWSAKIRAGLAVDQLSGAIDLPPTLSELTGVDLIDGPALDGVSLAPLLREEEFQHQRRTIFSHWGGRTAVRSEWLMLDEQNRLYDLNVDPGQTKDLAHDRPSDVQRLMQRRKAWIREVVPDKQIAKRPFTVGYGGLTETHLPVRDATAKGGVMRSNKHYNSTYFTNWRTTADSIHWDVEVASQGRYRAKIYYTCPEADAGSTVELRCGDAACQATVAPGYDPPLTAAIRDRAPRMEGDMKAFKPLLLGELSLPAGQNDLNLHALEVPGGSVMDVRLLVLERVKAQ